MDLFGKEVTLFQSGAGDDVKTAAANVSVLKGVLQGMDKEKRKRILSAVKENLMQM